MRPLLLLLIVAVLAFPACRPTNNQADPNAGTIKQENPLTHDELRSALAAVQPLHHPLGESQLGDWLTTNDEPGQSFDEYLQLNPVRVIDKRRVLYVQPLGAFTSAQRRIITLTAEFMSRFFNLPVHVNEDMPLSLVPKSARRIHPQWGDKQLHAGYITMNILKPALPEDAAAMIAFTAADLYPGPELNFVFGQASLVERVGVWSLYRLGDPQDNEQSFKLTLLRTLKIAAHETGHMFSIRHCTKYECVMCGSNHIGETDRRPVEVCPECMAKICWATAAHPLERYEKLTAFFAAQGFTEEQRFYEALIKAMRERRAG